MSGLRPRWPLAPHLALPNRSSFEGPCEAMLPLSFGSIWLCDLSRSAAHALPSRKGVAGPFPRRFADLNSRRKSFFHVVSATSSEGPRNSLAGRRAVAADGCMGTAHVSSRGQRGRSPDIYRNLQKDLSLISLCKFCEAKGARGLGRRGRRGACRELFCGVRSGF
jgi:hypothetical protein